MLKYRIFFCGYGGSLYDACKNDIFGEDYDIEFDSVELAASYIEMVGKGDFNLRKDLTYVILPVFKFE